MIYAAFGPTKIGPLVFDNYNWVESWMNTLKDATHLLLGGGKGVDALIQRWAIAKTIRYEIVVPNFSSVTVSVSAGERELAKKSAFDARNIVMFDRCTAGIVFWDGMQPAMVNLISNLMIRNKKVVCFPISIRP